MAVRRLSQSFLSTRGRGKSSSLIAGYGFGVDEMDLIERAVAGPSGLASITFSSIPQTYRHLVLRCSLRGNRVGFVSEQVYLRFNGDSNANYCSHYLYGAGAGGGVSGSNVNSSVIFFDQMVGNNEAANIFSSHVVSILDYRAPSKFRVVRSFGGYDINGTPGGNTGFAWMGSGAWLNTNAISSITVLSNSAFVQHSAVALYGVVG